MARKYRPYRPYTGILADTSFKPSRYPKPVEAMTVDEWLAEGRKTWLAYEPILRAKMDALFDHFEIDHNDPAKWESLATALAWTYVPGFLPSVKRPGRKRRNGHTDAVLMRVLAAAEAAGKSVANEARQLVKRAPFTGKDPDRLRQRYYRLKKK